MSGWRVTSKYSCGRRGRPECRSASEYSSGRPATPDCSSRWHNRVLPLRGVAQTRYERATFLTASVYNSPVPPRPNILYLHSHDTGRYVQPYGHQVPTPNIQALADQGVLFRNAFCAAPTCSASRACLLTGQYGHVNGMLGLAHRGWSLRDYHHHMVNVLRGAGYRSVLIGEQHIAKEPAAIGFD